MRTFVHYYFDQRHAITGKFGGSRLPMDKDVDTDEKAIAWAKARMEQFPHIKVENICCQVITMRDVPME